MIVKRKAEQTVHRFENGYGASVISNGYGRESGLLELAVVRFVDGDKYDLDYSTPITDDVLGHLTDQQVGETLERIRLLDPDAVNEAYKVRRIEKLEADIADIQKQIAAIRAE